ncbi:hypothetical protein HYV82_03220 [Candidatus Woesearchaeota archaeon]|nr:hypothetical protein [Candidatus Woesearchaeota archaeon]
MGLSRYLLPAVFSAGISASVLSCGSPPVPAAEVPVPVGRLEALLSSIPPDRRFEISLPEGFAGTVLLGMFSEMNGLRLTSGICVTHVDPRGLGSRTSAQIYNSEGILTVAELINRSAAMGHTTCVEHPPSGLWGLVYEFETREGLVTYGVIVYYVPGKEKA